MSKEDTETMQYWGIMAVCSTISLGAICGETRNSRGSSELFAIAVSSIGLILGILFLIMNKWTSVSGTPNYMNGTIVELVVALILAILWATGLGVINTNIIGDGGVVANANIYYFSWGAFISTILLCAHILHVQTSNENEKTPPRWTRWCILVVSSLVVLSSSTSIWKESMCVPNTHLCKRTVLGIGLGTSAAFSSMMVLCLGKVALERGRNPNDILQVEFLVSFLFCVAFGFGVGFITGPQGPAHVIGDLYYSTWISFVTSVMLFLDCVREFDPQALFREDLPKSAVGRDTPEA